jgi:hypothetical protein
VRTRRELLTGCAALIGAGIARAAASEPPLEVTYYYLPG